MNTKFPTELDIPYIFSVSYWCAHPASVFQLSTRQLELTEEAGHLAGEPALVLPALRLEVHLGCRVSYHVTYEYSGGRCVHSHT